MSDLQPWGIAFVVGGVERHFLFTLAAVDEIRRTGSSEKEVTKQEIKWALDVPAAGDDDR